MQLQPVACNNCGGPLQVPESANFVTCTHCDTQLAVRRNDSVRFTESLEQLRETTEALSEQVQQLTTKSALQNLDARWQRQQERFYIQQKDGNRVLPTRGAAVGGGIFGVVFGIGWMIFAATINPTFALFGLIFIAFGAFTSILAYNKAVEFEQAQRDYHWKREELLRQGDDGADSAEFRNRP